MKEQYNARDIGKALGISIRYLQRRAVEENWPFIDVPGRGGATRHYPYAFLPEEVRRAILIREGGREVQGSEVKVQGSRFKVQSSEFKEETPGEEKPGRGIRAWLGVKERERAVALARLAVLKVQEQWLGEPLASEATAKSSNQNEKNGGRGRGHKTMRLKEFYGRLNFILGRAGGNARPTGNPGPGDAGAMVELKKLGFKEHEIPEVLARVKKVSFQTAYRWQKGLRRSRQKGNGSGIVGLVRSYLEGKGYGARTMTPDMRAFVRTLLVKGQVKLFPGGPPGETGPLLTCNRTLLWRRLKENFPQVPHPAHFNRWINQYLFQEGEGLAAICLPSWWRANCAPKAGLASEDAEYFGQRWEVDATKADVMLKDGRHEIVVAIDVFSRDVVIEVEKNATSMTVAKLVRQGLLAWGVPEEIKTDRGLIFKSKHIQGAAAHLGITLELCDGYAPWQKPHVESFNYVVSRVLFEALPWYIGHNPMDRKRIEEYHRFQQVFYHRRGTKISCEATAAELRRVLSDWLAKVYRMETHRFKDRVLGRSALIWERQAHTPRRAPRMGQPELLDDLLAPSFDPVFNSGVSWLTEKYCPDSAEAWQAAQSFARQKVIFKPSLSDAGKGTLWRRLEDGTAGAFICRVDNRLRGGLDTGEYMKATRKIASIHKRRRKEAERMTGPPGYDRVLAAMPLPKVAVAGFGAPTYEGGAYRSLKDYDDRFNLRLAPDTARDDRIAQGAAALEQNRQDREQAREDLKQSPEVRRYEGLIRREAKGELIEGDDAQFMRFFKVSEAYQDLKEYFEQIRMEAVTEIWDG